MINETDLPQRAEDDASPATECVALDGDISIDSREIAALSAALAGALGNPDDGVAMLHRQAQLLDRLLYAVIDRKMQADFDRGRAGDEWIALALQIQKQCMETVKSISAIDYMKALAPVRPLLPPSAGDGKQKEGGRKFQK